MQGKVTPGDSEREEHRQDNESFFNKHHVLDDGGGAGNTRQVIQKRDVWLACDLSYAQKCTIGFDPFRQPFLAPFFGSPDFVPPMGGKQNPDTGAGIQFEI